MTAARQFQEKLERAVPRVDAWRQSPTGNPSATGSYKEWMHFCLSLPGERPGHLLVNLNVTESATPTARARTARLITLGYLDDGWCGQLETFAARQVAGRPGGLDLTLGANELRWREGAFHLSLATPDITADVRLEPMVLPTIASRVSFGREHAIHWVTLPRLEASGWVQLRGRRVPLERAPAYHDHNWGDFRWGGDLAWEWGFVNPMDPRSPFNVVFVRVSDRGRHRTLSQSVLLWRHDTLVRTFEDREVRTTLEGVHGGPRPFTLPKIASLLTPGTSSGVPARVVVEARGREEHLRIVFETTSKARVGIPSDVDPFGLVVLNETCGEARVSGETRAGAFAFAAPSIMEFVRG
jgi:hypothetical protein